MVTVAYDLLSEIPRHHRSVRVAWCNSASDGSGRSWLGTSAWPGVVWGGVVFFFKRSLRPVDGIGGFRADPGPPRLPPGPAGSATYPRNVIREPRAAGFRQRSTAIGLAQIQQAWRFIGKPQRKRTTYLRDRMRRFYQPTPAHEMRTPLDHPCAGLSPSLYRNRGAGTRHGDGDCRGSKSEVPPEWSASSGRLCCWGPGWIGAPTLPIERQNWWTCLALGHRRGRCMNAAGPVCRPIRNDFTIDGGGDVTGTARGPWRRGPLRQVLGTLRPNALQQHHGKRHTISRARRHQRRRKNGDSGGRRRRGPGKSQEGCTAGVFERLSIRTDSLRAPSAQRPGVVWGVG